MRWKVLIKTKMIPVAYRMMIVSLIKEALQQSDHAYYLKLYDTTKQKPVSKPFATAVKLNGFEMRNDEFHLSGGIELIISTSEYEFGVNLYNGLISIGEFSYKSYSMSIEKVILLPEKTVSAKIHCTTQSPIHLERKDNTAITPEEDDFEDELNYYADLTLLNVKGRGLKQRLIFKPIAMKKQIVKEDNREWQKQGKSLIFTAWSGQFLLEGDPQDLQLLYQLGIGKRRNQGFGLFELM